MVRAFPSRPSSSNGTHSVVNTASSVSVKSVWSSGSSQSDRFPQLPHQPDPDPEPDPEASSTSMSLEESSEPPRLLHLHHGLHGTELQDGYWMCSCSVPPTAGHQCHLQQHRNWSNPLNHTQRNTGGTRRSLHQTHSDDGQSDSNPPFLLIAHLKIKKYQALWKWETTLVNM